MCISVLGWGLGDFLGFYFLCCSYIIQNCFVCCLFGVLVMPFSKYQDYVSRVVNAPYSEKMVPFVSLQEPHKLALCIIEPREHALLPGILRQFVHVYKDHSNVSLTVIHGKKNRDFANAVVPWSNVHMVELEKENLTIEEYSDFCCSPSFWQLFENASHVLIFQSDTWIFQPIPEVYFHFAYTGAPWNHTPPGCIPLVGGNGGLSLRRVSSMMHICKNHKRIPNEPEDVFFCRLLSPTDVCPYEIAKAFSVESVWYPTPIGFHKAYELLTDGEYYSMMDHSMSKLQTQ